MLVSNMATKVHFVILAAVLALSQVSCARHILQAPAAGMNPPVLESGPATTSAPATGANAAAANAAGTNATGEIAAGNNAAVAKSTLSNTTYPTLEAALTAANLTTLAAAVQAAGLPANATENVTILAPTNKAFTQRLQKDLQMTPQQLLQNKTLLVEVRECC